MSTALEQLEAALPLLAHTLRHHWSTGQGKRVRAIVWSLYGGDHPVGLGFAPSRIDTKLARALGPAIPTPGEARPAVEPFFKAALEESGELARYEEAAAKIPDHLPTPYPPPELTARQLRELADALDILHSDE